MPANVLSKVVAWAQVVTRRSSTSLLSGFRVVSTPCSAPHAASTVATRTAFRLLPHGFHRVWIFHPVRVRLGRVDTVLQSVLTVAPVASIATASSMDVGVLPTLGSAAWARMKRAEQVGAGRFLAAAGATSTPARSTGADTSRARRRRVVDMGPPLPQSARHEERFLCRAIPSRAAEHGAC